MILDRALNEVEEAELQSLVANEQRENARIEFKRDNYEWNDAGTKEFLADVSSLANARGGVLLIGMAESDGCASDVVGIEGNADEEILRMHGKLESGIEPRIQGIDIKAIRLVSERNVIALRVPQSWQRPHMVTFRNLSRFYGRNSAGKYQLDVTDLRSQFLGAAGMVESLKKYRSSRVLKIESEETPVPLEDGAKLILHALPFSSFQPGFSVSMPDLTESNELRAPIMSAGWSWRYNFDGLVTFTNRNDPVCSTYLQLFRSGVVEAVDCRLLREWEGKYFIASTKFEQELLQAVDRYRKLLRLVEIMPPVAWALTLTQVRGYYMAVGPGRGINATIERDSLLVPLVLEEESETPVESIVRKLVDPVWQACGYERSINFEGNSWSPK